MNNKILVIDSGIGGLHILKHCEKLINGAEFVYVADTINAPYGSKSKKKLKQIAVNLTKKFIDLYKPQIVVLACNTLTVNSIHFLRKKFPKTKFVGTEPALKQALVYGGDTLILSTPSTKKSISALHRRIVWQIKREHKKLGLKYYHDYKLYKLSIKNLAEVIESNLDNLDNVIPLLKNFTTQFKRCKNLVIGCTHYTAIIPQIQQLFPNVQIFDGSTAVAKQVCRVFKQQSIANNNNLLIHFASTDNNKKNLEKIKKYYFKIKK